MEAEEQAGRLYRRAREYPRALQWLRSVAADAASPVQRDRARWLILDILFATDPRDLARQVASEAATWNDASYFSSLLHSRIAELVAGRKWRDAGRPVARTGCRGPRRRAGAALLPARPRVAGGGDPPPARRPARRRRRHSLGDGAFPVPGRRTQGPGRVLRHPRGQHARRPSRPRRAGRAVRPGAGGFGAGSRRLGLPVVRAHRAGLRPSLGCPRRPQRSAGPRRGAPIRPGR